MPMFALPGMGAQRGNAAKLWQTQLHFARRAKDQPTSLRGRTLDGWPPVRRSLIRPGAQSCPTKPKRSIVVDTEGVKQPTRYSIYHAGVFGGGSRPHALSKDPRRAPTRFRR